MADMENRVRMELSVESVTDGEGVARDTEVIRYWVRDSPASREEYEAEMAAIDADLMTATTEAYAEMDAGRAEVAARNEADRAEQAMAAEPALLELQEKLGLSDTATEILRRNNLAGLVPGTDTQAGE